MKEEFQIPEEIYNHYAAGKEHGRLQKIKGILEFERSKQIISRYIKNEKLQILDIGGGTGIYSKWLASLGHEVYLIDPMPNLIQKAKELDKEQLIKEIKIGDVRNLKYQDNRFDLIICFGPFYHLTEKQDRRIALKELERVLKKGSNVLIAGISKYVSLIQSGFFDGMIENQVFKKIVEQDIIDGQHRNPIDSTTYFTTSIFMESKELIDEVIKAGFKAVNCTAVEGPAWLHKNLDEIVKDKKRLQSLMDLITKIENKESIMGISTHFIVNGKK